MLHQLLVCRLGQSTTFLDSHQRNNEWNDVMALQFRLFYNVNYLLVLRQWAITYCDGVIYTIVEGEVNKYIQQR